MKIKAACLICSCILLFFFFQLLYLESGFLSVAYLAVANLARLGISVHCQASVRSQCLVRLLSQCWITGGHTIHPSIEGLLPQLVPNPHRSGIQPPNQLDYRCIPLHPAFSFIEYAWMVSIFQKFEESDRKHFQIENTYGACIQKF